MKSILLLLFAVITLTANGFAQPKSFGVLSQQHQGHHNEDVVDGVKSNSLRFMAVVSRDDDDNNNDNVEDDQKHPQPHRRRHLLRIGLSKMMKKTRKITKRGKRLVMKYIPPIAMGIFTVADVGIVPFVTTSVVTTPISDQHQSNSAVANAAVAVGSGRFRFYRRVEEIDFQKDAEKRVEKMLMEKQKQEIKEHGAKVRYIQATKGKKARLQFERKYREQILLEKAEKRLRLKQLKYELLKQGIDPEHDPDGKAEIFKHNTGYDLADFVNTRQNIDRIAKEETEITPRVTADFYRDQRTMIRLLVENLLDRGIDPVLYYDRNPDIFERVSEMGEESLLREIEKVKENMAKYNSPDPPAEGKLSVKQQMEKYPERFTKRVQEPIKSLPKVLRKARKKAKRDEARDKERFKIEKADEEAGRERTFLEREMDRLGIPVPEAASSSSEPAPVDG